MKTFSRSGSLIPVIVSLLILASCSKDLDQQPVKEDNTVSLKSVASCAPFVGIQTRQNDSLNSFVFLGDHAAPLAIDQPMYKSTFGSNLICFSATGGSPYYDPQVIRIGVTNQWIDPGEILSLKLCGVLSTKAANAFQMLLKSNNGVGKATFYRLGKKTGEIDIIAIGILEPYITYQAISDVFDFDEVRFTVSAGKLALTGFTPNSVTPGPGGFFLVEKAGTAAVMRFANGTTKIPLIGGVDYPNQFITFMTNYIPALPGDRQNRDTTVAEGAPGSGEFPPYVIPGSKHWLTVTGSGPLNFKGIPSHRLGVSDLTIDPGETITFTPGADFPSTKFRSVQVREAVLPTAAVGSARLLIECFDGATLVASGITAGDDRSFTQVNSMVEFDRVVVSHHSSTVTNKPSIGRPTPGPIAAVIKLYPGCSAP